MNIDQNKRKRNKWILSLLAVATICGLWYLLNFGTSTTPSETTETSGQISKEPGFPKAGAEAPAREQAVDMVQSVADRNLPLPSHVPNRQPAYTRATETALDNYEAGAEYMIVGRVMTDKEAPIPGATVTLYASRSSVRYELQDPLAVQICDDRGWYRIHLKSPLDAHIGVRAKGYAQVEETFSIDQPGIIVRNYRLREARAGIEGRVLDANGEAVAGALVFVHFPKIAFSGDFSSISGQFDVTDESGIFSILEIPEGEIEGKVSVQASARGYRPGGKNVRVRNNLIERVEIRLERARTIAIDVKTRSGKPIPGAIGKLTESVWSTTANELGRLEFLVPPESKQLTCTVKAKGFLAVTLTINPEFPPAEVRLDEGPVLRGRVLSESGRALAKVTVAVVGTGDRLGRHEGSAITDEAGAFSVPLSFPPLLSVRAEKAGYLEYRELFEPGSRPLNLEIRMRRVDGGIYGRVIDATGSPVSRFTIGLLPKPPLPAAQGFYRSFDNSLGVFSIIDVPAGVYTIKVQSYGFPISIWRSDHIEIRKGFFWGELLVELIATPTP